MINKTIRDRGMTEKLDFKFDDENDALLHLNDMQFHQDKTTAASSRLMKHILPAALAAVDAELDRPRKNEVKDEVEFRTDLMMAITLSCVNTTVNMLINVMPPYLIVDHLDGIADQFAATMKAHGQQIREQYGVSEIKNDDG